MNGFVWTLFGRGWSLSVTPAHTSIIQTCWGIQSRRTMQWPLCPYVKHTRLLLLSYSASFGGFITARNYCLNTMLSMHADTPSYRIPLRSGLRLYTHMLTSSVSVLLLSVSVCVYLCVYWWLVPIALVSCCSSSFRSSTEVMGEFLTRSTRDGGSGSPCGDRDRQL